MNGTLFLENLINRGIPATFRLLEAKDIQGVPVAQDDESIIVMRDGSVETTLIYKKAISVITPSGGVHGGNTQAIP